MAGYTLGCLEHDIAGEAVGYDYIGVVGEQVSAFNIAYEATADLFLPLLGLKQRIRLFHQGIALGFFFADGQQPDPRGLHAETVLGVNGAHAGELQQPRRLTVGVGSAI